MAHPYPLPTSRWLMGLLLVSALPAAAQFQVSSVSPARNARSAARATNVGITFNQAVNPATAGNVRVYSGQRGGQLVRGGNATASGSTLTVDPAVDLRAGETVFVTVPATVQSSTSVAAAKQVYQFTAGVAGGTGVYSGAASVAVGTGPFNIKSADVDGDG
ncbi:Ig-like domain-containing protein, partial [Hymenobacter persicinus]